MDYPAGSFVPAVRWTIADGGTGKGQGGVIVREQLGRLT